MKMYEKLGMDTEAALKWTTACLTGTRMCDDCPAYKIMPDNMRVSNCASEFLLSEVQEPPKVPRVALIQTLEDLRKALTDLRVVCKKYRKCDDCLYYKIAGDAVPLGRCFFWYLSELVDAPEAKE